MIHYQWWRCTRGRFIIKLQPLLIVAVFLRYRSYEDYDEAACVRWDCVDMVFSMWGRNSSDDEAEISTTTKKDWASYEGIIQTSTRYSLLRSLWTDWSVTSSLGPTCMASRKRSSIWAKLAKQSRSQSLRAKSIESGDQDHESPEFHAMNRRASREADSTIPTTTSTTWLSKFLSLQQSPV